MSKDADYYKLPKSRQWLGIDSPYQIEGVPTEFSLISDFLANRMEYRFRGNVPPAIAQRVESLRQQLARAEDAVQEFIMFVAEQIEE